MANHSRPDTQPDADSHAETRAAGLRFTTDSDPGIRRLRTRNSFRYVDANGRPVHDVPTLTRIRALAIPPAWTQVWICPMTNGHMQATGRDARGRKQYRYHPAWRTYRDAIKFRHLADFARALPGIHDQIDRDLRRHDLPRGKVIALVIALLEQTLIRIGNDAYARTNHSYGLTTMQIRHVTIDKSALHFRFVGKSGKEHRVDLRDRRLVRIVGRCHDLPGQRLFLYEGDDRLCHPVDSSDINTWLIEATGQQITAKEFRTWAGTVRAAALLRQLPVPESDAIANHEIVTVVDAVAELLGNTRTVARSSYIHPAMFDAYRSGELQAIRPRALRAVRFAELNDDERVVLHILEQATA